MHRRRRKADCRKYKKWKEGRARASKQTEKGMEKRKLKELAIDGLAEDGEMEEVAPSKTVSKMKYRKCRKGRTKETPWKCIRKLVRRISCAELVLGCIKPSLEERKYLLHPRHIGCVGLGVDIAPETPTASQIYVSDRPRRRKICGRSYWRRPEPEGSECDRVCSFDSNVCLAGVKLTAKDKEEVKKYRHEAPKAI